VVVNLFEKFNEKCGSPLKDDGFLILKKSQDKN
jgi:hypothetical protein